MARFMLRRVLAPAPAPEPDLQSIAKPKDPMTMPFHRLRVGDRFVHVETDAVYEKTGIDTARGVTVPDTTLDFTSVSESVEVTSNLWLERFGQALRGA